MKNIHLGKLFDADPPYTWVEIMAVDIDGKHEIVVECMSNFVRYMRERGGPRVKPNKNRQREIMDQVKEMLHMLTEDFT